MISLSREVDKTLFDYEPVQKRDKASLALYSRSIHEPGPTNKQTNKQSLRRALVWNIPSLEKVA